MPEGSIESREIWKRFRADRRKPRLREEFERAVNRARGSSDKSYRWALQEVDFRLEPGGSIGLIGANGSGKSTLLKILTRVMYPTAGSVAVEGRVGALIEVRAGIHADLTGRENIYLMGSLMGLARRRIAERFDEIVAFAELEQAIDRQVKFYSTGMQMRLGFGVAAFLEPDVLLVDEVLAVGDAAFQQRCLDRMRQVLNQGTTLVFVSHDLAAVEATCRRGVWLHNGEKRADGPVRETLAAYRASVEKNAEEAPRVQGRVRLAHAEVVVPDGTMVRTKGPLEVRLKLESDDAYLGAWLYLGVSEGTAAPIFVLNKNLDIVAGASEVRCLIPELPVPAGRYYVWMTSHEEDAPGSDGSELFSWQPIATFDAFGPGLDWAPTAIVRLAPIYVDASWEHERV